ncbi:MAG: PilW family protein [Gammaproteobacteria bacterium]
MVKDCLRERLQRGLSLVEIMIAMTVGLILLGGVFQVYSASKQSYRVADNLSRMQENARFAMNILTRDIRMAGFVPCQATSNVANTLNSPNFYFDFFNGAVRGYEGGESTFPAELDAAVSGTDAIVVIRGGDDVYSLDNHQPSNNAANFKIKGPHKFNDGDILVICDTNQASVFQTTNNNQNNGTIVHNTGNVVSPGNCTKNLGSSGGATCSSGSFKSHTFAPNSQLVKLEAAAYYIGQSVSGTTRSLYRRRLQITSSSTAEFKAEELVEGVENMQLLYGLDSNGDERADQYVRAHQVVAPQSWNDVVTVRLGLLVHTLDNVAPDFDTASYSLPGAAIAADGSDRRQRYVFTSTIKIRNRGLN